MKNVLNRFIVKELEIFLLHTINLSEYRECDNIMAIIKNIWLLTAKNIARPQANFKVAVDNSSLTPFVPKIKDKPNSLKPLAILPEYDENGIVVSYLHPYEFELMKLETPRNLLTPIDEPKRPRDIEKTPLIQVADEKGLKDLLYDLKHSTEFAVDLEHHSYRTFQGITCLMQISTRQKDYIVDTLSLRDELHVLNDVFTDPKILKIFHGALSDIDWLQRDLALYVVNMFDTSEAAKLLGFPRLSLAYLLKNYCNIEADKAFQLADWRIRPLPEELISYARQDTHYLIYIYEQLRNELLKRSNSEANLLVTAFKQSTEVCKRRYKKPKLTPDSHMDIFRKSKRPFDNRQLFALKEIFAWRDKIARTEDESCGYVLPNHMMLQIAESLPREMQGVLACCNPIPPLVRQHLHFLHQIILKAREQPLVKPIIDEVIVNRVVTVTTKDVNSRLHCPHDLSHVPEFRDDLPTLLGEQKRNLLENDSSRTSNPIISVFETPSNSKDEDIKKKLSSLRKVNFVSPYDRYKAAIPFAEQQRLKELEKEAELRSSKLLCPVNPQSIKQEDQPVQIKKEVEDGDLYKMPEVKEAKRKREADDTSELPMNVKKIKTEVSNKKNRSSTSFKETSPETLANSTQNIRSEVAPDEVQSYNQTPQNRLPNSRKFKNKNKGNKKKLTSNKTVQSSNQSVHVDFTKVDYSKFRGGSEKQKSDNAHAKFAGKKGRDKVNNKKFNKLFTFSTSNANKKN
ncbi:exosome component 10 isoform X2 [Hermetia illucens]|uniref:exosome component 10 isoform X2 n=1 Tax=Hermetia illucens TaxID=343691 RepID=UPI0018CBF3F9|nr:exosome component 10 isoform X2 [Hermetia illucens]